jgi:hypothetical protein
MVYNIFIDFIKFFLSGFNIYYIYLSKEKSHFRQIVTCLSIIYSSDYNNYYSNKEMFLY